MLADVLGIELVLPATEQGPGFGGAMLAAVAAGAFDSVAACAGSIVSERKRVTPNPDLASAYDRRYRVWHGLYPALRESFAEVAGGE